MAYETLNSLLNQMEDEHLEVLDAFVFKLGALLITEESRNDSPLDRNTAPNTLEENLPTLPADVLEQIKTALEKHPNVFHLETIERREDRAIYGSREGMLVEGSVFTIEINLPNARQKYRDMETSEKFKVICSGSYFSAYTAIQDIPVYTNIAHEFRELARDQIEKETRYKAPLFGPSPVWTDVIVARTTAMRSSNFENIRSHVHQGDLYLILGENTNIDAFMQRLFFQSVSYWSGFYQLMLRRCGMMDLDVELHNRLAETSEIVERIALIPSWKIRDVSNLATRAGLEIGRMHRSIIEYDRLCWEYDNDCREYLIRAQTRPYFRKLHQVTVRMVRRDLRPPQSMSSALQFLEKQIELARNIRSLVLASMLGAIAGALITGLLSLLRK